MKGHGGGMTSLPSTRKCERDRNGPQEAVRLKLVQTGNTVHLLFLFQLPLSLTISQYINVYKFEDEGGDVFSGGHFYHLM